MTDAHKTVFTILYRSLTGAYGCTAHCGQDNDDREVFKPTSSNVSHSYHSIYRPGLPTEVKSKPHINGWPKSLHLVPGRDGSILLEKMHSYDQQG